MLQVFTNLIANAFRHGSGRVVVSGDAAAGAVTVEVSDEGSEIPPERVAQLFVPFARWGSSRESTGLGLAVARRIVEAHGGSLTYRPPAPDRPHAFVVTVPRGGT
jgi:signal transduction histidine kinase